ncbi:unnamed protein product [Calypogeia fissa]
MVVRPVIGIKAYEEYTMGFKYDRRSRLQRSEVSEPLTEVRDPSWLMVTWDNNGVVRVSCLGSTNNRKKAESIREKAQLRDLVLWFQCVLT